MDPGPHVLLLNIVAGSLWHTNTLQFLPGVPGGLQSGNRTEWR